MKPLIKIGLLLGALFLTLVMGIGIGVGVSSFRTYAGEAAMIEPTIRIERPLAEEIVLSELEPELAAADQMVEEITIERGRTVEITPPTAPRMPRTVFLHRGPGLLLHWLGSLLRTLIAATLILGGVWLIVRRNRQPVEKSPES